MPFTEAGKDIIRQSFRNAVYIDDKAVGAYENVDTEEFRKSKVIYDDFRNHDCTLEIYNYKNYEEWVRYKEYHLKRKDLLILDWMLKEHDDTFQDTLRILEHGVNTENLHFICIYTDIPAEDIENKVIYRLNAYFSNCIEKKYNYLVEKIKYKLEDLGLDAEEILNKLKRKLKELSLRKNDGQIIGTLLREILTELYDIDQGMKTWITNDVFNELKVNHRDLLINIGFILNGCLISESVDLNTIKSISGNSIIINNTIIHVFNKNQIKPSELHKEFSSALLSGSNNFMTILGLEIRALLMESSAFIGKEIDSIDEDAFFHHEAESSSRDEFFEFLKQIWKEQSSSFLLKKELRILRLLDDYKKQNGIKERLERIDWNNRIKQKSLAMLNFHYNILLTKRNNIDFIRFGDLFEVYKKGYDYDYHAEGMFLLNITAHCDCIRPEKNIKSNFFFVRGAKHDIEKILKEGDTDFNSFINYNNDYIGIKWIPKPFNVFVDSKNNHIGDYIPVNIFGNQRYLKFLCTIKENYTQRITNESFAHAARVGIYFTGLKSQNNN